MRLKAGLLFASDTRTNAGVDHIASFGKMHQFQIPHQREIVILNAGNLATTQSVLSLLRQRLQGEGEHLLNVPSLYDAAVLVGRTLKEVVARDSDARSLSQGVDFGANFLLGGQIRGEGRASSTSTRRAISSKRPKTRPTSRSARASTANPSSTA